LLYKSSRCLDEIKPVSPLTLRGKTSSRSDFIHGSGLHPPSADLTEKSTSKEVLF
jgi:hypothetical protein